MSEQLKSVDRESEGFARLRKLFLAVKFSKHDAKNVEARIESTSRISGVTASTSKGVRQRLSNEEYREVVNALSKDLGLDAEAVARLHGVTNDHDSVDGGVLEEVHPRPSTFGYVAAARVPGEGVDVVHIVCEAEAQLNFSCFDWFASARKKLLQKSYVDAIVINYMRNRIVEELKVERLTTRRGHHRKPEHRLQLPSSSPSRPESTSVASQSDSESEDEEE